MIKPFHKLTYQEFLWLVKEKATWQEIEKDFPQPLWCSYHGALHGQMGCWSLVTFENYKITHEFQCLRCDCVTLGYFQNKIIGICGINR